MSAEFIVESAVSQRTGQGFVNLKWGEEHGQMTSEEARTFALHILSASEAADQDAATMGFVRSKVGANDAEAVAFMQGMRAHRGQPIGSYRFAFGVTDGKHRN